MPAAIASLEKDLRRAVGGEVRFDEGSRRLYANDASIYRQVPVGVVIPRDAEDVVHGVEVCRAHDAAILGRGGGTGLAGQSVNAAVLFDFSKYMNRITELDPDRRTARVEPGVICDQLRDAAREHGLNFAPDPATHDHNTLGGMIGNNSCGTHSVAGGKTVDNVYELDLLTYDGQRMTAGCGEEGRLDELAAQEGRPGELYRGMRELRDRYADLIRARYPDIPRRVSGYNLDDLLPEKGFNPARALVGSESTCVLVLGATVRLLHNPPRRSLLVLGYPDSPAAAEHVEAMLASRPLGLEFFEAGILGNLRRKGFASKGMDELPEGEVWVLVEHGGETQEEAHAQAERLVQELRRQPRPPSLRLYDDPGLEADIWEVRRSAIGSTRIPGEHAGLAGWEDAAVHPSRLPGYLRDFKELVARYGYHTVLFGHFGQGCIHNRLDLDLTTQEGIDRFRSFLEDATELAVKHGGSLSGEHGDGQLRAALLPKMFGPELVEAFTEFKRLWDPRGRMNPGKLVAPYSPVQNLRLGADYQPAQVATFFRFPEDAGSFANAADRCFGVGKCRHLSGGTMCPSFMVTREERHSTRGRARLLFEMMQQTGRRDVWRDEAVKGALDLCLSCKGCKGDCPVRVDMATYKAEFLAHYYEGRLRPPPAYAMGLLMYWAQLAERAPRLVNAATHTPVLSRIGKRALGLAPQRAAPAFATRTYREWFAARREMARPGGEPVLLWPDTFNDHFHPETLIAATEVLEAAGFRVRIPDSRLCCGRPLYDYGMVPRARRLLRKVLEELRPQIRAGVPLVGLEPSCTATFRDELINLFPDDQDARRLQSQTRSLSELLLERAPGLQLSLPGRALYHGHCHQKALWGAGSDLELLRSLGLDVETPDTGCCGLAGSFGYEHGDRYEVSVKAGERVLGPAVRAADPEMLVVADGFSCRSQIEHLSARRGLHLAEVLHLALQADRVPRDGSPEPEARYRGSIGAPPRGTRVGKGMLGLGGLALVGGAAVAAAGRRRG